MKLRFDNFVLNEDDDDDDDDDDDEEQTDRRQTDRRTDEFTKTKYFPFGTSRGREAVPGINSHG